MKRLMKPTFTPPPRLLNFWIGIVAAALVAVAAPVWAQNVTAPGLIGPPACQGTSEIDTFDLAEVANITANSARFRPKNVNNLYAQLRASSGDGGPTSFPILYTVHNAKTGASQGPYNIRTVDSSNPNFGGNGANASFPTKTPHYFTVFTTAAGWGGSRPLTRRCFMTGGNYTTSTLSSGTSGCFSISPRTPQDVRNCLCGRSNLAQTAIIHGTDGKQGQPGHSHEQAKTNLGCAN